MHLDWLANEQSQDTSALPAVQPWKVLVVDDDEDVHRVTHLALRRFRYENRGVELLKALNGEQACQLASDHPDLAVIFLDVVMETEDAGLRVIDHIRNQLKNRLVRIIIRTGQAGRAPEIDVVTRYDINGYREKTELTSDKLMSQLYTALSSYRDLQALKTEIRRREDADNKLVQQYAQLQEVNHRLENFARAASHDLQEPLRKIRLWTDRLTGHLNLQPGSDGKLAADKLTASATQISEMIEGLRRSSMLDARPSVSEKIQLGGLLNDVLTKTRERMDHHSLSFDIGELGVIQGDSASLRLLFRTLIDEMVVNNPALPATGVKVSACPAPRDEVCIHMDIDAYGIAPEELAKLFEPYSRAVINQLPSQGIGLYLCKRIIEANAGSIEVKSTPGEGTEITIRLQRAPGSDPV